MEKTKTKQGNKLYIYTTLSERGKKTVKIQIEMSPENSEHVAASKNVRTVASYKKEEKNSSLGFSHHQRSSILDKILTAHKIELTFKSP